MKKSKSFPSSPGCDKMIPTLGNVPKYKGTSVYRHPLVSSASSLLLSKACKEIVQETDSIWIIDFIWLFQGFEKAKDQPFQKWTISDKKSGNSSVSKINALSVVCYSCNDLSDKPAILDSWEFKNYPFPFNELTLLYKEGLCVLIGELI